MPTPFGNTLTETHNCRVLQLLMRTDSMTSILRHFKYFHFGLRNFPYLFPFDIPL